MFDQLKQMGALLGQAKDLKARFEQVQQELARRTVEGDAGAGAVRVTMNGKLDVLRVTLDQPMITALAGSGDEADREIIEELIAAAANSALEKAKALIQEEMRKATGGLNLPGMDGLLGSSGG